MTKEDRAYCVKHGYCTRCGEVKTENGRRTCKACTATLREYQRTYWAKMPPEKKQAMHERNRKLNKKRYAELKAAGLCVVCGKPAKAGHVRCEKCELKNNRSAREYYAKKHDATPRVLFGDGYHCQTCGKPVEGKQFCESCYKAHCESLKKVRAAYAESGKRWHSLDFRKDKPKELKPFE